MIPKIIHQTYKTNQLPDDLLKWHQKIVLLHPSWQVKLWTDEDNLALVKQHFPHMLEVYLKLPYPIMQVDMVRYMYMAVYGGVYMDLDYELFTSLDASVKGTNLLLPLSREKKENDFYKKKVIIGNCIFASTPNHIFWQDVLDKLNTNALTGNFANKIDILKLTGPEFITDIYFQNPHKYQATLPGKYVFHPDMLLAKKQGYAQELLQNGTLGLHHCKKSWLQENNSVANYLASIKASLERRKEHFAYSVKSYLNFSTVGNFK